MSFDLSIQGSVERVTYYNEENGYCVLRVKVPDQKDLVTVVGHSSSVTPGEYIESTGQWIQHRDFGTQFKANLIRMIHPSTLEGIEKYLGSGMVKGIGPHFAKKLVEAFELDVFTVIENTPEKLRTVPGIGPARIQKITSAWQDQKIIRDIMVFLQSHGISTSKSVRIFKTYGQDAISQVSSNPYQLAKDIHGIGFKSADTIASHLGISKTSMMRARAGVNHVLLERVGGGHCAYPEEDLIVESNILLEIDIPTIKNAIELEVQEGSLFRESIEETPCLYPASIYRCETEATKLLLSLKASQTPWKEVHAETALAWVQSFLKIELAPLQKEAVETSLRNKVLVITGGPGTGKTTLTRSIVSILQEKKVRITLCSPTGRAAKRLSECTGLEAKTIHRLLGFDPKKQNFIYNQNNPLPTDLLIVDEASMIDIALLYSLLKAIPKQAAVILVGDVDQIPSVGPGTVLKSIIDSGIIPTIRLTQVFRQATESRIIQAAHRINQGQMPDTESKEKNSDFYFIQSEDPTLAVQKIIDLVSNRIPKAFGLNPIRDIQVLCPMNRGQIGGRALNLELQKSLNSKSSTKIERFGLTFSPGDKVMVIANDYDKEIFNGDIGIIQSLDLVEQEAVIDFDGREVLFEFNEMDILSLAYATSIHKAQGSEYPAVVIPVFMQHYMMLKRNLIYTGITRGKKLVILIGQKKALGIAIRTKNQGTRWSNLSHWLRSSILVD
jgi:exodeoxyribonuclease V alpha subunit